MQGLWLPTVGPGGVDGEGHDARGGVPAGAVGVRRPGLVLGLLFRFVPASAHAEGYGASEDGRTTYGDRVDPEDPQLCPQLRSP